MKYEQCEHKHNFKSKFKLDIYRKGSQNDYWFLVTSQYCSHKHLLSFSCDLIYHISYLQRTKVLLICKACIDIWFWPPNDIKINSKMIKICVGIWNQRLWSVVMVITYGYRCPPNKFCIHITSIWSGGNTISRVRQGNSGFVEYYSRNEICILRVGGRTQSWRWYLTDLTSLSLY